MLTQSVLSVPDNLLTLIFQASKSNPREENSNLLPFKLASVCRRFRAVALTAPQLWGTLSSSFRTKPEAVDLRLERSQDAGLEIHIGDFPLSMGVRGGEDGCIQWLNSFLATAVAHCQRWTRLDITLSSKKHPAAVEAIEKTLSANGASFPCLLSMAIPGVESPLKFFQIMGNHAPNLQFISMSVGVTFGKDLELPKSVTRLAIESNGWDIKVHYLAKLLRSAPIEELCLDFSSHYGEFKCKTVQFEGKKRTVQIAICSVKSLEFIFPASSELDTLLEGLHFPRLERLSISICDPVDEHYGAHRRRAHNEFDFEYDGYDSDYGDDVEYFQQGPAEEAADAGLELSKLFFKDKEFPKLRFLSLKLDINGARLLSKELPEEYFIDIFKSSPNLHDLKLQCLYSTKSLLLPPLRSLELKRCALDHWCRWIKDYGDLLTNYEKMGHFRRLTLNQCGIDDVKYSQSEEEWHKKLPQFTSKLVVICERHIKSSPS